MWVFYLISLPLTLGMVFLTLKYFSGPHVPRYMFFTVGYTWFCSISIIILVPADIWLTVIGHDNGGISFFWRWSYWSTFLLTWLAVTLIQGYEDAGDFTMVERLKTSVHVNLLFYLIVGSIGLLGLLLIITTHKNWIGGRGIMGWAMACSNTFGLVTGAFLLCFGLAEIPKSIWRNSDWTIRHKFLSHKIAKLALKLDDAHQELSNAIVVAQATSKQMSKRDPLRPYMEVIDNMLVQMFEEDPSFRPQGGRLGENDTDYDADEKSMATLRWHLRGVRENYYRFKSEYLTYVTRRLLSWKIQSATMKDAMLLDGSLFQASDLSVPVPWGPSSIWQVIIGFNGSLKFISSFRPERTGTLGPFLDMAELVWRCILQKQLQKVLSVILGCISAAILLAEATLLTSGVDLSLFSILIKSVGNEEVLVQVLAFIPLMFMCVCTYFSLFKVGRLMFYLLTPKQTSALMWLMYILHLPIRMVARYAHPISYNFLNLISLGEGKKTIFEQRMGNIDQAVPFFGDGFNSIYPLIMVIYTILVASNFFDRIISFFGNKKLFKFHTEAEDVDGFDPSGLLILQKERTFLEQGHKVGEHVIPLARNFNGVDLESGSSNNDYRVEMKTASDNSKEAINGSSSKKPLNDNARRYAWSKEAISSKYAAIKDHPKSDASSIENISSAKVSLLDAGKTLPGNNLAPSGLASKWASMKQGLQNMKANIEAKKFLPLGQAHETKQQLSIVSSSESLDEKFQRLKRPSDDHGRIGDDE